MPVSFLHSSGRPFVECDGLKFHPDTKPHIAEALALAFRLRLRIAVTLGNAETGWAWQRPYCGTVAAIGSGTHRFPVLVKSLRRRDYWQLPFTDVVRIVVAVTGGAILYQHPSYTEIAPSARTAS